MTRFYDLNRANRQNLADVEDDEHGEASGLESLSEHEMAPPRQRPRLSISMAEQDTQQENPETPPDLAPAPSAQPEAPSTQHPTAALESAEPQELSDVARTATTSIPMSPGSLSQLSQEPSEEPPIQSGRQRPMPINPHRRWIHRPLHSMRPRRERPSSNSASVSTDRKR